MEKFDFLCFQKVFGSEKMQNCVPVARASPASIWLPDAPPRRASSLTFAHSCLLHCASGARRAGAPRIQDAMLRTSRRAAAPAASNIL